MRIQRGFTLIEISVVILVMATLLGFITINLVRSQQGASLTSAQEVLVVDLRQQQLKAMIGDTEGRSTSDPYGIHFDSNRYVLFHGSVYSSSDASNFTVNLDSNMQFNNPNFDVIFSKISGTTSTSTIELRDNTNSKLKRIHLNSLGVVNQIESL
jgi:prepilin-type N-terminal cleavage/methylation domain-containing protein